MIDANLKKSNFFNYNIHSFTPDFGNVSRSYNLALIKHSKNFEVIIFVHEDVFFPDTFEGQLKQALKDLEGIDWGVLGVAGARAENGGRTFHGNIKDRGREWGKPISKPIPVQTVDELMLIVNTKADLSFDEQFPLDFYGADICMQSKDFGHGVFVIPGYVHHNSSRPFGGRTPSFYESEKKFKAKWSWVEEPIATTCTLIKK